MAEQQSFSESNASTPVDKPSQDIPSQVINGEWTPSKQVKILILGQLIVVFVVAIDLTILTATLPTVSQALGATAVQSFWIAASYLLANAVVQPLMAALADIFGRRPAFLTALVLFTVGTVVCCTAKSVGQMIAGRTIQGIGGGGILSINLIIFSDLVPLRQRSKYIGLVLMVSALGLNIAPIIGAALLKSTWRWLFYINFPFCAIGLSVVPFTLRYEATQTTTRQRFATVDWEGSLSFICGITIFLVGISWGGNQYSWRSVAVLVPMLVGILIIVVTIFWERAIAKNPFLRLSLFNSVGACVAYFCTVLQSLALFACTYFIVLYLLTVKLYSPILAGTVLLAYGLVCVPVSGVVGAIITKMGAYRWAILSGWLVSTLGLGGLTGLGVDTPTSGMIFILLIAGTGQGVLLMAHSVATTASCENVDIAHANGMYSFMRSLGLCLGVALGGTIFQNLLRHQLGHAGLDTAIAANAEGFVAVLQAMPAGAAKTAIMEAYARAFQLLFATLTGISGLGFVLSFQIGSHTLDKALESKHKLSSRGGKAQGEGSQGTEMVDV